MHCWSETVRYTVQDDMFSHLRIIDIGDDTYVILFYSELLKK